MGGAYPVGETQNRPFQLSFNPALRIEFQGSRVTSDGGLLLVRELDERLGLGDLIARHLTDPRGPNTQFPLADLIRQSLYHRLAGYEDVNDAERLAQDPTFRLIGSEPLWERGAALRSRVHSFETELLTRDENLTGLAAINRALVARVDAMGSPRRVVLDIDSTEVPVYGEQEQSAYNGHYESTCYHPLLLFDREGDCLAAKLRPGNVLSAEGWEEVLLPEIERQQRENKEVVVRADAAFAKPELYEALEKRDVRYAIRIPSNDILEPEVAEMLTRSVGRPSHKPVVRYKSFQYQAASWETARRIVAKIEFHCGELFPRVGFIVTTLETDSRAVVGFFQISSIRDRVVQGALKLILEPIFEADFQPGSYGYRPKQTAHQAVARVAEAIVLRKTRVIDLDLAAYFDNVPHHALLGMVAKRVSDPAVLRLLKLILRATGRRGLPQGGPLSPVLSNIYLTPVDCMLEKAHETTRHGSFWYVTYARWADDLVILVHADHRQDWLLKAVHRRLREELAKLGIPVNEAKSRVVDLEQGEAFTFLGFDFRQVRNPHGAWWPQYTPTRHKRTELLQKLREVFRRQRSHSGQQLIREINPILAGWLTYFRIGHAGRCFAYIQHWVEKKVRRHLARAAQRPGFGWKRWSRERLYHEMGLYDDYSIRYVRRAPKALPA